MLIYVVGLCIQNQQDFISRSLVGPVLMMFVCREYLCGVFLFLSFLFFVSFFTKYPGTTLFISQLGFPAKGNVNSKPRLKRQAYGHKFSGETIFPYNLELR